MVRGHWGDMIGNIDEAADVVEVPEDAKGQGSLRFVDYTLTV